MKVFDITAQEAELKKLEDELSKAEVVNDPNLFRNLTRRHKHLSEVVDTGRRLAKAQSAVAECEKIISENADHELTELAKEELSEAQS